jgi:replicative DNA helicase
MDYNRAREELKPRLKDYVESITSKSKGANMYVCPICGSGTGHNHTGAFSIDKSNPNRFKCFSCGLSGDLFDLIGAVENITDPLEQLKRAGELYGITIEGRPTAEEDFREVAQNQPKNERYTHMDIHTNTYTHTDTETNLAYYRECQSHLQETDYHLKRGISQQTANRFMLGYDSQYTKSTGGAVWQALIIPTGYYSYVARNTDPQADSKSRYRKTGQATPLNSKALQTATKPIFIVEGEIDALSIIEAGGEAIGLGSTANIDLFINNYLKKQKPAQPLVIALDNDEKGQTATEKLEKALAELGLAYYIYNPAGEHKDANEALIADRDTFIQAVAHAEHLEEEALEAEREEYLKTSSYSHLQEFINGIAESVNTPATPTGFYSLDEILDGGLYEGLYILGAITSLGKTTLALQIADQIADSGRDVLIFSLEMARAELMSKSISRLTLLDVLENGGEISNAKTNRGITAGARWARYSQTEKDLIQRAISSYGEYAKHIYIHEGIGDIGVEQIRETIERHIRFTGRKPLVLVDYLQIVAPYSERATDKQNTDKAVLELKRISRDFKTTVIAISSLNRMSYKDAISMEAFKESGAIEYSADVLLGLQLKGAGKKGFDATAEKKKNPRTIELVILKNRNGAVGERATFAYYPLFNFFEEE